LTGEGFFFLTLWPFSLDNWQQCQTFGLLRNGLFLFLFLFFSPRICQPTRSHLKLAWHDWLKCDQSKNVFFDSSINCWEYSPGFLLCYNKWFRGLMRMKRNVLRGITLQLAVRRQAANLNPVSHTWISEH